jgi:hypothetical protein
MNAAADKISSGRGAWRVVTDPDMCCGRTMRCCMYCRWLPQVICGPD